jgi:hypothetical protein
MLQENPVRFPVRITLRRCFQYSTMKLVVVKVRTVATLLEVCIFQLRLAVHGAKTHSQALRTKRK